MRKHFFPALTVAGLLAVSPAVAEAGGSDAPIPYDVTDAGVILPKGETFPAHGHVNVRIDGQGYGIHFDPNNNQPGGAWIGKNFIPWTAFGVDTGCVEWVQIHGFNEHFGEGGQTPVCFGDETPEPGPTVDPSITQFHDAQCDAISITPTLNDGEGEGTYEVKAHYYDSETVTQIGEQVFDGSVVWGETIVIDLEPAADDYLLWSYRFDASVGGRGVTLYGERQLDCRPVEVPESGEPVVPEDSEVPVVEDPATPEVGEPEVPEGEQPVVELPEAPEVPEVATPEAPGREPTTGQVVTEKTTTIPTGGAIPIKAEPVTVG